MVHNAWHRRRRLKQWRLLASILFGKDIGCSESGAGLHSLLDCLLGDLELQLISRSTSLPYLISSLLSFSLADDGRMRRTQILGREAAIEELLTDLAPPRLNATLNTSITSNSPKPPDECEKVWMHTTQTSQRPLLSQFTRHSRASGLSTQPHC